MHGMENVKLYRITKHAKIFILMAESMITKIACLHISSNFLLLTLMKASCDLYESTFSFFITCYVHFVIHSLPDVISLLSLQH